MKKKYFAIILLISISFSVQVTLAQDNTVKNVNWKKLNNTHDLLISTWGPFSKKYAGISHLQEMKSGIRFDFSVFPGLYRYKPSIPNVQMQSDYYPWECNNDLTQYTFRHELEWK